MVEMGVYLIVVPVSVAYKELLLTWISVWIRKFGGFLFIVS